MVHVLVRVNFEDFETWKDGFTAASPMRQSFGSQGVTVYRSSDSPNHVVILGTYEDKARAQQLFQSQEFRDATKRAGLTAPPEITFLDEAFQLSA